MKVRVVLMTENNEHIPNKTNEELEAVARKGWEALINIANAITPDEKATVEFVEVIEN